MRGLMATAGIMVVIAGSGRGVYPVHAATMRTLRCASARYQMTIPPSWTVIHGCGQTMTLYGPGGTIGMGVTNYRMTTWSMGVGRTTVQTLLRSMVSPNTAMVVIKGGTMNTRLIAGHPFIDSDEEVADGANRYILAALAAYQRPHVYLFVTLVRFTGIPGVEKANTATILRIWYSIRLL